MRRLVILLGIHLLLIASSCCTLALQEHNMEEAGTHQTTAVSKLGFGRGGVSGGGRSGSSVGASARAGGGGGGVRGGGRGYRPGRAGMLPVYGAAAGAGAAAAAASHERDRNTHRGSAPQTFPALFSTFPFFLLSLGLFLVNF